MPIFNIFAICLMLLSAFVLYTLNYDARLIETQVHFLDRRAAILRSDIALLKAEKAHLSRPERIEPFARSLGLQPLKAHQILKVPQTQIVIKPPE